MHFDDSDEKFRQSSKSFGWKCKLNWKKIVFVNGIPQKVLGSIECKFDKTDETFFSKLRFFSLEPEVKKKHDKLLQRKSRSSLDTTSAVLATLLKIFTRGVDDYHSKSENNLEKTSKKDNLSQCAPPNT